MDIEQPENDPRKFLSELVQHEKANPLYLWIRAKVRLHVCGALDMSMEAWLSQGTALTAPGMHSQRLNGEAVQSTYKRAWLQRFQRVNLV